MKHNLKFIFVFFALFLLLMPFVQASLNIQVKGLPESNAPVSVITGETVPVTITFKATKDVDEVIVKAELNYSKGKIESKSLPFDIINNATYTLDGDKALYLAVPIDITENDEHTTIRVTIEDKDGDIISGNGSEYTKTFSIIIQRESNRLDIKSVTLPDAFKAGDQSLISVTVKNIGSNSQDNVYVETRIPALGLVSKALVGYVESKDGKNEATDEIPIILSEQIKTGVYAMKVRAFNDRTSIEKTVDIRINGLENEILLTDITPLQVIQEVEQGKRATYKIVILNLGTKEQTYTISPRDADDWATVQASPTSVTLDKDKSATIEVFLSPKENIIGEKTFKTYIKENNELVKEIDFVADVKKVESQQQFDPFTISLVGFALIAFFIIVIFMGLRMRGIYNMKVKAVEAIGQAKDAGREAAKNDAAELISAIMGKVLDADERHLEVAKERAAGRAQDVIENLREDEVEEVFSTAVKKLGDKKTEGMDKKAKADMYDTIKGHSHDIIEKITHKLSEKELDDVVENVADKLSNEEIEDTGVDETIGTLTKLKEKISDHIEKLKVEEEEEVIKPMKEKAEKKAKRKIKKSKKR